MTEVRFLLPATKSIKKLKDKKLKMLYQEAVDKIRPDYTVGEAKTGDLSGVYGYDIYYNKANYEPAYTVEYSENEVIVVIMPRSWSRWKSMFWQCSGHYNDK